MWWLAGAISCWSSCRFVPQHLGKGIDVRKRKIWDMYGTQTVLEVRQFTFTTFGVLTVVIFKLIFDVLMLFSTSKGSIRNGGRHLSPPSGSPLVIWQRAADYFHFSSSIIHWLFGEHTWCPQGCTFLVLGFTCDVGHTSFQYEKFLK